MGYSEPHRETGSREYAAQIEAPRRPSGAGGESPGGTLKSSLELPAAFDQCRCPEEAVDVVHQRLDVERDRDHLVEVGAFAAHDRCPGYGGCQKPKRSGG